MDLRVIDGKTGASGPNHGKMANSPAIFPPHCSTNGNVRQLGAAVSSASYTRRVYSILPATLRLKRITGPNLCIQGRSPGLRRKHGKFATYTPHCGVNRADRHENS